MQSHSQDVRGRVPKDYLYPLMLRTIVNKPQGLRRSLWLACGEEQRLQWIPAVTWRKEVLAQSPPRKIPAGS